MEAKSLVDPEFKLGHTPLMDSCLRHDEEAVKIAQLLLEHGAQIEHRGELSHTPFLAASGHATATVVELLLTLGADIRAVDQDGFTSLLLATCNRLHGPSIIPLLVKAGVDVPCSTWRSGQLWLVRSDPMLISCVPSRHSTNQLANLYSLCLPGIA